MRTYNYKKCIDIFITVKNKNFILKFISKSLNNNCILYILVIYIFGITSLSHRFCLLLMIHLLSRPFFVFLYCMSTVALLGIFFRGFSRLGFLL